MHFAIYLDDAALIQTDIFPLRFEWDTTLTSDGEKKISLIMLDARRNGVNRILESFTVFVRNHPDTISRDNVTNQKDVQSPGSINPQEGNGFIYSNHPQINPNPSNPFVRVVPDICKIQNAENISLTDTDKALSSPAIAIGLNNNKLYMGRQNGEAAMWDIQKHQGKKLDIPLDMMHPIRLITGNEAYICWLSEWDDKTDANVPGSYGHCYISSYDIEKKEIKQYFFSHNGDQLVMANDKLIIHQYPIKVTKNPPASMPSGSITDNSQLQPHYSQFLTIGDSYMLDLKTDDVELLSDNEASKYDRMVSLPDPILKQIGNDIVWINYHYGNPKSLWWTNKLEAALFYSSSDGSNSAAFMPWNEKNLIVKDFAGDDNGCWLATSRDIRYLDINKCTAQKGYQGMVRVPLGTQIQPETPAEKKLSSLVDVWQGVPYKWAGASRTGADCSGFVMAVYKDLGISLPHGTQYLASARGGITVHDQLHYGDVLVYPGHCAIYLGNGVTTETVSGKGVWKSNIWRRCDVTVKRFLNQPETSHLASRHQKRKR
jgi:hypothetical protein